MSLNVELLEQSFAQIKPRADEFVVSFYENLFIAYPEVQPLFAKTEMNKQYKKLLNSLVLVVESIRHPEALEAVLQALGARHVSYGVIRAYYPGVGQALLATFEQYLQDNWTPEIKQAWTDAYMAITLQMLKGAGEDVTPEQLQLDMGEIPGTVKEQFNPTKAPEPVVESEPEAALPVEILESSFDLIKPRAEEFVVSFYENLFAANPEMQPLFGNTDMSKQYKKLLNSLVLVVEGLRNPEALAEVLQALGARHVGYGTVPKYYRPVGQALLNTFAQYLGENWTPEVEKAWTNAYRSITAQMLKGATAASDTSKATQKRKTAIPDKSSESKAPSPVTTAGYQRQSSKGKRALGGQSLPFLGEIAAKFQGLQPLIASFERLLAIIIEFLQKILAVFWSIPIWGVALIATIIMILIFLNLDSGSLLARVMERSNHISMVVALVLFLREAPLRRKQYRYQAWRTIDGATGVKVSHARIMALQDLNGDGVALKGLDAPGADLVEIHLPKANMSDAKLSKTDFSNANLSDTNLNNADMSEAKLVLTNLSGANLSFAKLNQANLSSANLSGANLICTDFSKANLSGANLSWARLGGANLDGTYLMGANLKGAQVTSAELRGAFLEGAIMPDGSKYKSQKS
ncbi:MAG: hypothetical protein Fur0025_19180 [Oscillatoriaceae cyanobacterium]